MPTEAPLVGTVDRLLALKRHNIFGSLPAGELAIVAEASRERFFRKGQVLFDEEEPIESIFLVIDGQVHMTLGGKLIGHATPGAAAGGIGLFARTEDAIGAIAETDVMALELDIDAITEIFEAHSSILLHTVRQVCRLIVAEAEQHPEALLEMFEALNTAVSVNELDFVGRLFVLRRAEPFKRTSINALAELAKNMEGVRYSAGDGLWEEAENSGMVLLVVEGRVECWRGDLRFDAGPGASLGAVDSVAGVPRLFGARAATDVIALKGYSRVMLDIFEDNFEMARDYLAVVSQLLISLKRNQETGFEHEYGCDAPAESKGSSG